MKNIRDIVAIILAGGKSKRFWPLNNKNLLDFTEGNLLEYHLKTLIGLGVKDFIVIGNTEVTAFLRVNSKYYKGIAIHRVLQDEANHGIGKAVLLAWSVYEKYYLTRPVYVLNADDIYDFSIHRQLFGQMLTKHSFALFAAFEVSEHKPFGYFKVDKDKIIGIIEKPMPDKVPSNLTNMALHLYSDFSKLIDCLKDELSAKDERDDLYERAINQLCQKYDVSYIKYTGRWEILKYPWNVLDVSDYFLSTIDKKVSEKTSIDKTAKIEGPVIIEDEVKILEFAVIRGPAVIKKGTIIGTSSLVRNSIIGKNCIVGFRSEVTRSYVGNNCWFHTNYIGDSVLGDNVNMGAGSVFANLRLDQKNIYSKIGDNKVDTGRTKLGAISGNGVQIGVNVSIMPGIKIGKNSCLGPGVILNEDLEDNTSLLSIQQQVKKKNRVSFASSRKHFRELLKR